MSDKAVVIEMTYLINELSEELTKLKSFEATNGLCDVGDIGNEIGIVIAKYLDYKSINNFLRGMEHGISLTTGSHDSDDVEDLIISTEVISVEERKASAERVRLMNINFGKVYGTSEPDFNVLVGMTENEASGFCVALGYFLQLSVKDGVEHIHTLEMNPDRVHVDVENDIVTKFRGVG